MTKPQSRKLPIVDPYALPIFNGVSVNKIEIEQNGDLHVTFDLPTPTHTTHFRTDVQGKRSFDLYEDPVLRDAAAALFQLLRERINQPDPDRAGIDCMKCTESTCCREYDVFVASSDIERIATHLKITREEVERDRLTPLLDWTGDFAFHLAQDEDDEGKKCTFLTRDAGGSMRCGIYEARPQLCRDFDHQDCTLFDGGDSAEE